MIRRWSTLGALVTVTFVVALSPSSAPAQTPKRGGVLRLVERADPVGFDTLGKKKASVYTQLALGYTHNRLFKYGPKGEIVPDLAASVAQPNATTYVVTLKKGVRWHARPPVNGRELVADDVKFTFERVAASPEARLFPTLKRVTTPDRYTVQFELSAPFSAFIANLAATTMYVYARDAGNPPADGGRDYTSVETVVGTGPFVLDEYREKQRLVLKRNPTYFEPGKPYLDGAEVYVIPDVSAQIAALRTGKVDALLSTTGQGLPHLQAPEVRSIPGVTVIKHAIFQTGENLVGRMDAKPWNDVRVRRAVALAIDREAFLKAVYPEGGLPLSGPIPLLSVYATAFDKLGDAARLYRYDPAAARKLLAEAGYPNGFKTRLVTTSGYGPEYVSRTELLKDMLSQIGVEASIVTQEYPEWIATSTPGDTRNHIHVNDAKLTDLVRRAREAPDEATRARMIREFVRTFHENMFRVFLPQPAVLSAIAPRVKGYVPPVRGYSYPTALVNVWVE